MTSIVDLTTEKFSIEKMLSGEGKKVCVTGASGFIASWLVKLLLERGYIVNGTVRSLNDPTKTEHLLRLKGAKERLHLFEADLLKEGSFDSAIHGCDGVFHTATPIILQSTNPEEEVIDPAVKGTLNVLASCLKSPTVTRVIFTSSIVAALHNGRLLTNGTIVDETWFSTPEGCKGFIYEFYAIAKTTSEEVAGRFAKENGIDFISMIPAVVIGPTLQPTLNLSNQVILNLINGTETYNNEVQGWVNVKDVAMAHILAFEVPTAKGRYCLVESVAHYADIVKYLKELYPNAILPHKCVDDGPLKPKYQVSKDKTQSLGINYIPIKTSLKETVESLKEKGFIDKV